MKKIILIVIAVITLSINAQESALLRFNPKQGSSYLIDIKVQQDPSPIKLMKFQMKRNVISNSNGVIKTENSLSNIAMKTSNFSYDSSMKESEMNEKQKKMHKRAKSKMLALVVGMDFDQFSKMSNIKIIKGKGDIQAFKQSQGLIYPKEKVKKGSSWTKEVSFDFYKVSYTYKVNKISDGFVYLKITGNVNGNSNSIVKGDAKIKIDTGNVVYSNMTINIELQGQKVKNEIFMTSKEIK